MKKTLLTTACLTLFVGLYAVFIFFNKDNLIPLAQTAPNFELSLTPNETVYAQNQEVDHVLVIRNSGSETLNDVLIAQSLSEHVAYVENSASMTKNGQTVTIDNGWISSGTNAGALAVNGEVSFKFRVRVKDTVPNGTQVTDILQVKANEVPDWKQVSSRFTIQPTRATIESGNVLTGMNNTLQSAIGNEITAEPLHVIELFVDFGVSGTVNAENATIFIDLPTNHSTL